MKQYVELKKNKFSFENALIKVTVVISEWLILIALIVVFHSYFDEGWTPINRWVQFGIVILWICGTYVLWEIFNIKTKPILNESLEKIEVKRVKP